MDLRIRQESIGCLCQRFSDIEKPYLLSGFVSRPNEGPTPATASEWDSEETATRYQDDGFSHDYCEMTLGLRFRWLKTKSEVTSLWTTLNRLQLRRIARESTYGLLCVHPRQARARE